MNHGINTNYATGRKGRKWTQSLHAAHRQGAVIVVEDTDPVVVVEYSPYVANTGCPAAARFRPWVSVDDGTRYDSRDCIPEFEEEL